MAHKKIQVTDQQLETDAHQKKHHALEDNIDWSLQ